MSRREKVGLAPPDGLGFKCAIVTFVHLVKTPRGNARTTRTHTSTSADVMGQCTRTVDAVALLADLGDGRVKWTMSTKVPRSERVIARLDGLCKVVDTKAERRPKTVDRVL
jgi:uncharacterized protein YabE (DUF348 family)